MTRIATIIAAAILLSACGSTTVEDTDTKRKELQEYKQQVHELQQKIEILEKELSGTEEKEIVPVKVQELAEQPFEHFVEITGNVEADLNVNVSPESSGIIESIPVAEGQKVSRGQVLAKLKTDALERSIDELKVQYSLAQTNFERQKNLWEQNIGSEMQFLQARTNKESLEKRIEALQAQLEMADIKSPVNGVVDAIYQKKGEIGTPQFPFARVVNIEKVKVYADVSEAYLTKIKKGDTVKIFMPSLYREVETTVQQIGNVIDPNNRTFRIRMNLDNPDRMIKPNLVTVVKLRDYKAENAIVVPSLFIKEDFKGNYTFIAEKRGADTVAKKIYVTPGVTDNNMTEITEGLATGMKIISEGYNQIVDGSYLQF